MHVEALLGSWNSFFVIVGSAAAALTGLMFVVVTLVSARGERQQSAADGMKMFSTPTVAHFGAALFISALLSAPWHTFIGPQVGLGLLGVAGIAYVARLIAHGRNLVTYTPDVQDWLWYTTLPILGYLAVTAGAVMLVRASAHAMFGIAFGALLLIFIGIHNSWDVVSYLAVNDPSDDT